MAQTGEKNKTKKKRGKKKKRNQKTDQQTWWEAEGEERLPSLRKTPSWRRNQLGQKKNFVGSKEKAADGLWKAGQSKDCTYDLYHNSAHSSLNHESPATKGSWVLERGVWSADPGRGQLLAVKRQPEGTRARGATTRKVCGDSLRHHSKTSLSRSVQGAEPPL